ncbi:MAG TPA: DinB family protein [Bryobacteraceae bacterium]
MPESEYGFKPTPDVRTFGQLIAHVADAQMRICGVAKGEPKQGDAASKASKADLVAALKASNDFCDAVYSAATDADGAAMVKIFGKEKPKLGVLMMNVGHDNEMYGTIAVYLRLKGIVPPSTEGAAGRR